MIRFLWELLQKNYGVYVFLIDKELKYKFGPVKNFSYDEIVGSLVHFTGEREPVERRGHEELYKLEAYVSELVLQKVRWSDNDRLSYEEKVNGY